MHLHHFLSPCSTTLHNRSFLLSPEHACCRGSLALSILFPTVVLEALYCALTQLKQGSIGAAVPSTKDTQEEAATLSWRPGASPVSGETQQALFQVYIRASETCVLLLVSQRLFLSMTHGTCLWGRRLTVRTPGDSAARCISSQGPCWVR